MELSTEQVMMTVADYKQEADINLMKFNGAQMRIEELKSSLEFVHEEHRKLVALLMDAKQVIAQQQLEIQSMKPKPEVEEISGPTSPEDPST